MTKEDIKKIVGELCGLYPISKKARISIELRMIMLYNKAMDDAAKGATMRKTSLGDGQYQYSIAQESITNLKIKE